MLIPQIWPAVEISSLALVGKNLVHNGLETKSSHCEPFAEI